MRMEQSTHILSHTKGERRFSPNASIKDQYGRTFNYLRIAVNDVCNLRCIYCMPEDGNKFCDKKRLITQNEIYKIINISAELGVNKIRFTGGEPLLHPHIVSFIKMASQTPRIDYVNITTNAIYLNRNALKLKQAGLIGINISLDTLDPKKYALITRRDLFNYAMEGLKTALLTGFLSVKINVVVLRGFNDNELINFVKLTKNNSITVRFIELMPFDAHQIWKTGKFVSAAHIKQIILKEFSEMMPANGTRTEHYIYQIPGHLGKVAIIPAFSRNLCSGCNRIRITADGKIRNCLFANEEYNLLDKMRNGCSDDELKGILTGTMWKKPLDGWSNQKNYKKVRKSMSQIGG